MKKTLFLVLAVSLAAVSLVACSGKADPRAYVPYLYDRTHGVSCYMSAGSYGISCFTNLPNAGMAPEWIVP